MKTTTFWHIVGYIFLVFLLASVLIVDLGIYKEETKEDSIEHNIELTINEANIKVIVNTPKYDKDLMINKFDYDVVPENVYEYIGECVLTAYCCEPYEHICGTGTGLTASGIPVKPGIVAVDPSVIPLGSKVKIGDTEYYAADTGGAIKGLHIDIAFQTHQEALEFGLQKADVYILVEE